MNFRNRIFLFVALLAWCGALLAARIARSHHVTYFFLTWNLFLALIPAIAAMLFVHVRSTFARVAWFLVWLAFLPNAPYIATDFIHLRARPPIPLWYDVALLLSCAATGILFAFTSVADVQSVIAARWGKRIAWTFALVVLGLCGFGIYLGRFLRWNSWELATEPFAKLTYLAGSAAHPMSHPRTIAVTVIYGVTLALGYVAYQVGVRSGQST